MAQTGTYSFAAVAQKEQTKIPIRNVQLEGQVILKIAKHCKQQSSVSAVVTGQLLGLDVGQTLEVTDCFPFPVSAIKACYLDWHLTKFLIPRVILETRMQKKERDTS